MFPSRKPQWQRQPPQPRRQPQFEMDDDFERPPKPTYFKKNKSQSNKIRDDKKRDEHREKKGKETMEDIKKELDKSLFFGFTMDAKAIDAQRIKATPQAKVLPISTRSIGLATQAVFIKVNQTMRNVPQCSVYEAYRVSLAQMDYKLIESGRNQVQNSNVDINQYQMPTLPLDYRQALLGCQINFNITASAINAVGNFTYKDVSYYTKVPLLPQPHPLTVTFSNLRNTVQMLANANTDRNLRLTFYRNNPLPGAIWNGLIPRGRRRHDDEEPNPVLANPQDFWPDDYNVQQFIDDVQRFNSLLSWMSRKSLKYVNVESRIDYGAAGSPTCFVSSMMNQVVLWRDLDS